MMAEITEMTAEETAEAALTAVAAEKAEQEDAAGQTVAPTEVIVPFITLDANGLAQADGLITVYNFNALTGEFTGASDEYLMQGVGIPANACCDIPPAADDGTVAAYRDGSWQCLPDHRGETVYSTADGSAVLITEPGDYPAGSTLLEPATAFDKWDGEKWVTDAEAQQAAAVKAADSEKTTRISAANRATQAWQTQLLLGIITDDDKAALTAWMKYIQDVQAVDTSKAPDIDWPDAPQE